MQCGHSVGALSVAVPPGSPLFLLCFIRRSAMLFRELQSGHASTAKHHVNSTMCRSLPKFNDESKARMEFEEHLCLFCAHLIRSKVLFWGWESVLVPLATQNSTRK